MPALDQQSLRGEMRFNEPLSQHTTWRVGGPASCFYRPADREDLVAFLTQLDRDEPLFWLGLGSNLLVRDGGFRGTVIATKGTLVASEWRGDRLLYAEAGLACAKVARLAARAGLCGVEFLAGIPGTLGGALAMNAGAFGGETWERVVRVETIDRYGEVRDHEPGDFEIGYRQVNGPAGEWFLAAELQLEAGDGEAAQHRIKALLERRGATQPTNQPSCGSVFRNPPGDFAARLIESAGLKGRRLGGAQVSEKHANFIINTGSATAKDIELLIAEVQREVAARSGVELVTEVHRIGEAR
ncbi:MAG: UDP-N-acetylenolpyruvoylglucosamine reductase [gamma proteobacterium symbiont of Ctena orbiculata]|uniref:UDP-N-acetylenolpyruvoylglucosamine reductase n=1 Tax=Candidatus Thiodiazotropha taylori TaxID=2792791 RepID=A0A944M4C2_9GAMM|nr:UDP-N-acetylmuramate dehydrogenase [Candidatus Thiodiazotropha taylori]PUB86700.1 MAG: UDP-N-acetylenolpyruvoylglucosamine reductase [gamma proteobacterium symbiont of Ctena orbiculata]MBT2987791.1 UDP-N-acetylmuramate dehydrogenase [Candidatus Thiodiazotropha taylori]MBT2995822.1 UDP-N-acetylmuramate dehydrogenase [Candidatus Thiodiazotropha taylori]MBT2999137.1 UDP-N-acetylmuramate dehydrogenase [Candidatus Thiodiazotropha taylori]